MKVTRVGCIGAGNIAETHAAVIRSIPGLQFAAVADPDTERAAGFAKKWGVQKIYSSVDALVADRAVEAAHVLVPPPLHKAVAEKLLVAGIHVFLEKPMAQNVEEGEALQRAAARSGAALRVNHNIVHHPAQRTAKQILAANRIGPIRHVQCWYKLPLRQLGAGQLGHWMFDSPRNLLLEQAVHPLSQIDDLVGPARNLSVTSPPPLRLGDGRQVWRRWLVSLNCERGTAQLYLSFGDPYPSWGAVLLGDDGAIFADFAQNRVTHEVSGRWGDFFDSFRNGSRMAAAMEGQSIANLAGYVAGVLKLRRRSDYFFRSMTTSLSTFYDDLEHGRGDLAGTDGSRMVELCERIVERAELPDWRVVPARSVAEESPYSVLVIGGTGFIGAQVVSRLRARGAQVGVFARSIANLPPMFSGEGIRLIRGDARNAADVMRAIGKAKVVINLAHGGGGGSRAETEASLVGAARTVAESCLASGVGRLIFVSSIAALYLGDPAGVITGAVAADPEPDKRADYSRAKVLAEREMLQLFRSRGLPVTILRPGIVIGEGGIKFHSGVGFYNHENHCLGWNRGLNPLPLVLVEDVAEAIVQAVDAGNIEGKSYNLVGDVRLSAREYITELARVTGRPLKYHAQAVEKLYGLECLKTAVKRLTGRRDPWPTLRDLKSRGLLAPFDCSDASRDLAWTPVRDRAQFLRSGFEDNADPA